jgi:hypothetical protein
MTVYALDPGPEKSALVCVSDGTVSGHIWANNELLSAIKGGKIPPFSQHLVIESVESYGMPVGREVFETVFWSGRFAEAWQGRGLGCSWSRLPRRAVKLALCGSVRATDATIRQALVDRYGPGKEAAVGRKASQGPLYGIRKDLWQALALAVTYQLTLSQGSGSVPAGHAPHVAS